MSNPVLTEITVRSLRSPEKGQQTVWDAVPGFGVRVSQGGSKSFVVLLGSGQRHTIGRYPLISLADARIEAKRLLAERTLGKRRMPTITFAEGIKLFLDTHYEGRRERTKHDSERLLNRHFLPKLGKQRLEDITPHAVAGIIDKLKQTPSEQRHALTAIGTFFRWSIRRRYLSNNPASGMMLAPRPARQRVLSADEIAAVWQASQDDHPFDKIVRLCILLGQRRGEIGLLRAEYVKWTDRTITLPPQIVKNNRAHTFPFGPMAEDILRTLPKEGHLFPGRYDPEASFQGWYKCKAELDAKLEDVEPWTLHDLRRTFATNLAALGVPPHVVEKLLNHATGTISGVAAIYNRYKFMDEMREAIVKWEHRLAQLTHVPAA